MVRNPVPMVCVALGWWAVGFLPFVRVAPNRLVSGEPVFLLALVPGAAWSAVALLLALTLVAILPARHALHWVVAVMAVCLLAALFAVAGSYARAIAQAGSPLVRTALGAGFWGLVTLACLMCLDAVAKLHLKVLLRLLALIFLAAPLLATLALGYGDELSLLKEYANRSDVFATAVVRHIQIVALSVMASALIGMPLAWTLTRSVRLRTLVFPVLNIIQTIPSIALFGLLMAPLAWLASHNPALARAGITGVGLAPAVLALLLYSLLPIVRSTLAGLEQVPADVKTAALAMGMGNLHLFLRVELPLALPVVLVGLRTAVVQTMGLATVTALIGAGGLGALVFDGLFSAANELVVLAVLPIVLLALLADALFKALTALLRNARP